MLWFPDSTPLPHKAGMDVPAPEDLLAPLGDGAKARRRAGGLFRLWLGLAQMAGATIALLLLWGTGLSAGTITAFVLTTMLTLWSRLSFPRARKQGAALMPSRASSGTLAGRWRSPPPSC